MIQYNSDIQAQERDRTADLVLTKDVLCRLSYLGVLPSPLTYTPADFPCSAELLYRVDFCIT